MGTPLCPLPKLADQVVDLSLEPKILEKVEQYLSWNKEKKHTEIISDLYKSAQSPGRTEKLSELLLNRLEFGTAGLRGKMGPGFSQMNDLVIIQTTQGLVSYIDSLKIDSCHERGVVIGYDGRHNSWRYAALAAWTFVKRGFAVHRFSELVPTPFVPFCVREKNCIAGIMITASHNPKEYNGYKLYWDNGAQIIPPRDRDIQKHILDNLEPDEDAWDYVCLDGNPILMDPFGMMCTRYYEKLKMAVVDRMANKESDLNITYTALHGVGCFFMELAFEEAGFKPLTVVKAQCKPDPEFPTVTFPNPEEPHALDMALAHADRCGSNLVIANDPDADRLALAEKNPVTGDWRVFTGNELGILLGWWMFVSFRKLKPDVPTDDMYMIASAVSTKFLRSLAHIEKFHYIETLTGFKWMGNEASKLVDDKYVLFAFEEAMGYMCGTAVLDKDGISAGVQIAQMAVSLKRHKLTFERHLINLYDRYGHHLTKNGYLTCNDPTRIKIIFNKLRNWNGEKSYPESLAGGKYTIQYVRDLAVGLDTSQSDNVATLPSSPTTKMITFTFTNDFVVTLRASGTEPKIKYYSEFCRKPGDADFNSMAEIQDEMVEAIIMEYLEPDVNNLQYLVPPMKDAA